MTVYACRYCGAQNTSERWKRAHELAHQNSADRTTGSDEQRPAPRDIVVKCRDCLFARLVDSHGWVEEVRNAHEQRHPEHNVWIVGQTPPDPLCHVCGHQGHEDRDCEQCECTKAPAPESLPVGTDASRCWTCGHPHASHVMETDTCDDCAGGMCRMPAPVGTDSARAEAERRYPIDHASNDWDARVIKARARDTFVAGAEWARAEERKARGE